MKQFMDKDFLLSTETAKELFHGYAEGTPILDYHCHIDPKEIAEDRKFDNITQVWLGGDHYKWRLMRSNGVDEKYITGDASDREKFQKWAETLERGIGNPLYHWSHLELQRYFGYHGVLNKETAEEVCALLYAAINQVRRKAKWAEEVQSRRKGDPGTGWVEAIRYIPEAEVSHYAQSGTRIEEVPGFRLAESRTCPRS